MPNAGEVLDEELLAARLKQAREACRLSQASVAELAGMSRPTLAQIEACRRKVTGLELVRLGRIYGLTAAELLAEEFQPQATTVLLRALPEAESNPGIRTDLARLVAVVKEIASLRALLGIERPEPGLPSYPPCSASTQWQVVKQGTQLALSERSRVQLGLAPVPDVAALLETQGCLVFRLRLPQGVFGFTTRVGEDMVVVTDDGQGQYRERFSLCHEYCHALHDAQRRSVVCRESEADRLAEVRANAFAAAFLLPEEGVRRLLAQAGRGEPTRPRQTVLAGDEPSSHVSVEGRRVPHSQDLGPWDVAGLAGYFGVSWDAAVWRLRNLRLLSDQEKDSLLEAQCKSTGRLAMSVLRDQSPRPRRSTEDRSGDRALLALAQEALHLDLISTGKLREIGDLVGLERDRLEELIEESINSRRKML